MNFSADRKLDYILDRNDIHPWPFVFADEILTDDLSVLGLERHPRIILEEYIQGHLYYYADKHEMDVLAQDLLQQVTDPAYFQQVVDKIYELSDRLNEFGREVPAALSACSYGELLEIIRAYVVRLKELRLWGWVPALVDGMTEPFLSRACIQALAQDLPGASPEELNRIYSLLITPATLSEVQKSELDKYALMVALGEDCLLALTNAVDPREIVKAWPDVLQARIQTHLEKYAWVSFNYIGPVLSLKLLQEACKQVTISAAQAAFQEIENHQRETAEQQRTWLERHALSARTTHLLRVAASFLSIKEYRKSVYQRSYVVMDAVMREVARRLGCETNALHFLSVAEMERAEQEPEAFCQLARERADYCVVLVRAGASEYLQGEEARRVAAEYKLSEHQEQVSELQGQVAFPGLVTGVARIVFTRADLAKVQTGNILVSPATNPDLLPAMKKAAAIVTDMGGIVSHAAIISRELHIPCVVGTKIATKIIHDGDRLEVDAERGRVTIL